MMAASSRDLAKEECVGIWWSIRGLRQMRDESTCPLELISLTAQLDAAVFNYLAWGKAARYQRSERERIAANLVDHS